MTSFFVTKNECCTYDEDDGNAICAVGCCSAACMCCVDGDCRFGFGGARGGNRSPFAALALGIVVLFFLMFKAVKACGKHISRLVAIIALLLVNITLTVLSFYSGTGTYYILIAVFSIFAAICNLLGMILPNCASCEILSYEYPYSINDKINSEISTSQQLLTIQPQNEMPLVDEAYPGNEEVNKDQTNQSVTPNISVTNQGYDNDNRCSSASFDAAIPVYMEQENDVNNNGNILYSKPQ